MNRNLLFYIAVLLIFGAGVYFCLESGIRLESGRAISETQGEPSTSNSPSPQPDIHEAFSSNISRVLHENLHGPLSILLLQIVVILIISRLMGSLFVKFGQPAVIGEMVAGILLGPSLLGLLSPATVSFIFPVSSMALLGQLSQLGVILFMFIVGMDLNAQHLREKAHAAVMVSHASIVIPFFLGVTLALVVYRPLAPPNISFVAFALFLGIAMSITAFPVLARIVKERRMSDSYLGSLAIACAAVDDATAWCILTLVVAVVKADGFAATMLTIALVLLFVGAMVFLLKPRMSRIIRETGRDGGWNKGLVAVVLAFALACAWFTEVIGIHALFGAFLAGVVMPSVPGFRSFLREKLETSVSSFLLPLFFAFTGLRTQVSLLNDWQSWAMCVGIIAVAIAGKAGGSMLAARWTGMSWQDSFSMGALMNTRGLVELVVLNIGYDLGILPQRIFTIMVLMALVTTAMTGPLLTLINLVERKRTRLASGKEPVGSYEPT